MKLHWDVLSLTEYLSRHEIIVSAMKNFFVSLLFFAVLTAGAAHGQTAAIDTAEAVLRRDIGEMLLIGFRGTSIDSTHHIVRDIKDYHVGSVILFEYDSPSGTHHRNIASPSQLRRLCTDLQSLTPSTLFISIDQEGGRVARLKERDGFAASYSAQQTARQGTDSVRHNARIVAQMLRSAGINLNFAPCVDVNINPACPVIGRLERSFSGDPDEVSRCARIWMEEQMKAGVVSCLKHFPGHGSAKGDTHAGLVDVSSTWQETELEPYRTLIAQGKVEMVMVAHVINTRLGDTLPASLSPAVIRGKLRRDMGFNGVVVTDDLAMGAIAKQYGLEETLRLAILAGSDMLCLSNNGAQRYNPDIVPQAVEAIVRMVHEGKLSRTDIHASAERVRTLKHKQKR